MQVVRSRLGDDVKNSAARAAEFDAKVTGLHRDFLDGVGDVEALRKPGELDIIVLRAVQQIVVCARALTINREQRCLPSTYRPLYTEYCPQARWRPAACGRGKSD